MSEPTTIGLARRAQNKGPETIAIPADDMRGYTRAMLLCLIRLNPSYPRVTRLLEEAANLLHVPG